MKTVKIAITRVSIVTAVIISVETTSLSLLFFQWMGIHQRICLISLLTSPIINEKTDNKHPLHFPLYFLFSFVFVQESNFSNFIISFRVNSTLLLIIVSKELLELYYASTRKKNNN